MERTPAQANGQADELEVLLARLYEERCGRKTQHICMAEIAGIVPPWPPSAALGRRRSRVQRRTSGDENGHAAGRHYPLVTTTFLVIGIGRL